MRLNASLGALEFGQTRSVCRGVAMALPTRSARARLLWAALAVVLLLAASVAMMLYGTNLAFVDRVGIAIATFRHTELVSSNSKEPREALSRNSLSYRVRQPLQSLKCALISRSRSDPSEPSANSKTDSGSQ